MNNKSFQPIFHLSKRGQPMAYYLLDEDGTQTEVIRAECLAPATVSDIPFPQRWYVDEESGLVIRLPRTAKSDILARDNMRNIWRESKKQKRKASCSAEGSGRCPISCTDCPINDICESMHKAGGGILCVRKCEACSLHQPREMELDLTYDADCEEEIPHFVPTEENETESVLEEKSLLDTLYAALADLTQEDRDLMQAIYWDGKTERQLAPELGLKTPKSVNKRKRRVLKLLRENDALRDFFE